MSTLDGYLMVVIIAMTVWLTILYSWRFRVRLHNDSVASAEYCRGYDAGRAATLEIYKRAEPQTMDNLIPPGTAVEYPPNQFALAQAVEHMSSKLASIDRALICHGDDIEVLRERADIQRVAMDGLMNRIDAL